MPVYVFFLLILNFNYQIITKDKIAFCFKGEGSPLIFFMTFNFYKPFQWQGQEASTQPCCEEPLLKRFKNFHEKKFTIS